MTITTYEVTYADRTMNGQVMRAAFPHPVAWSLYETRQYQTAREWALKLAETDFAYAIKVNSITREECTPLN